MREKETNRTMLEPASLFTDGAVLCRDREIPVFGRANRGDTVRVRLEDRHGGLLAEESAQAMDGRFEVLLPPQPAQTGCRLVIACGEEQTEARDIAIGDVYLASGQSNMELEVRYAQGGVALIPDDPLLRFFNVPRKATVCEEQRQAIRETRWHAVDRETAAYNSAVASVFGTEMRRKHPEIPVGIIGCYWGGTSVTCWMDDDTLGTLTEGIRYKQEYEARCGDKTMAQYLKEEAAFHQYCENWDMKADQYRTAHPGAGWDEVMDVIGRLEWNPPAGPGSPFRPAGLAKSMLAEIAPAALTAALFYQGEEDTYRTDQYDMLLTAMIRYWRKIFRNAELPFLFVQLPMWVDYGAEDSYTWAKTRLAQAAVRDSVRNTDMVCLLDEGEYGNIHPVNKQPVGLRLAELASAMLYSGGECSPRALGKYTEGSRMTVCLSAPIQTKDGKEANLLEIAGESGEYVPAKAEIRGNRLLLSAEGLDHPVRARYAWTDWSDQVNLVGLNGLPLEPFAI